MRYQHLFPSVIPFFQAGYPRVTHPSATQLLTVNASIRCKKVSFDLHVLGTPPAFVLSQDQTLILKFVTHYFYQRIDFANVFASLQKPCTFVSSKLCLVFKDLLISYQQLTTFISYQVIIYLSITFSFNIFYHFLNQRQVICKHTIV